ncbi:MAG: fasciclin domain-containing protein [Planctomycetota bacterium]|jgi:hypothetical protein
MKSKRMVTVMSVLLVGLILVAGPAWARKPDHAKGGGKPDHAKGGGKPGPSIVDVAIELNSSGDFEGVFDTLIAAVLAADPIVLETLDGRGQFTVFAPTDDAFADIGQDPNTIGDLDQETLTDILLHAQRRIPETKRWYADRQPWTRSRYYCNRCQSRQWDYPRNQQGGPAVCTLM